MANQANETATASTEAAIPRKKPPAARPQRGLHVTTAKNAHCHGPETPNPNSGPRALLALKLGMREPSDRQLFDAALERINELEKELLRGPSRDE